MSAADEPRATGMWQDYLIAARTVIEDSGLLPQADCDRLAEAVTERLLGDFLTEAEASSVTVFTASGAGPRCSWCSRMVGPTISRGHPQYGIFCDCKRKAEPAEDAEEAA